MTRPLFKGRGLLAEEGAEGFFYLADGMDRNVVLLRVEPLKIIFRNNDVAEA